MVYKFFDQKIGSGMTSKKRSNLNEVLAKKLHKPVTKKFKRRKVYVRLKIIFGQLIQLKWDNLLKIMVLNVMCHRYFYQICLSETFAGQKTKTVPNGFIEVVNESQHKSNKIWVNLTQKLLDDNDILMYLTHNELKLVVAEIFIRNLKGKVYKKSDS